MFSIMPRVLQHAPEAQGAQHSYVAPGCLSDLRAWKYDLRDLVKLHVPGRNHSSSLELHVEFQSDMLH